MMHPFMRLRINELLQANDLTPWHLAKRSRGRITRSTAYRLSQVDGNVELVSLRVLEAMADVFKCTPNDLFER